jgi:putative aldouronate transport system substrate-binding protein
MLSFSRVRKGVIICFAAILVSALTLPGCAQTTSTTTSTKATTVATTKATDVVDLSKKLDLIWMGFNQQGVLPVEGSVLEKKVEEKYNVNITNVMVDQYNNDQVNVLLATGVDFDVWTQAKPDIKTVFDTGLIRELPAEMISKYAPAVMKIIDDASPDGSWKAVSSVNGVNYGVPTVARDFNTPISAAVRDDWMKAVGETKAPETLDQLEALFLKFRNNDPDGNGIKDTYALSKFASRPEQTTNICPYIFACYNVAINTWLIDQNGNPKWYATDPGYKQGLEVLVKWYNEEIIDPEVVLDTRKEFTAKFVNNKVGVVFNTEWALNKGDPVSPFQALMSQNANVKPFLLPPVKVDGGIAQTAQYSDEIPSTPITVFGKKTSDEKVARILKIFDDVYTDPEFYQMLMYGIKGEHFYVAADGSLTFNQDYTSKEAMNNVGMARFFNHQFTPESYLKYKLDKDNMEAWNWVKDYKKVPRHPYSAIKGAKEVEVQASLATIENEYFWKVLTGKANLTTDWDDYVSRWNAAGGDEMTAEKVAGYQAFLAATKK